MATSTLGSGTLVLAGTTSGTTTVTATAVAGTTTLTLPAATDTLVGKATTDTLTNKTLTGAAMNGTLGATTPSTVAATTISASSTATFAAGAAGTPSITTTGDTNTGIFFPAADTIAFAEGGAEVARFDSSGNFGLGVTPSAWSGIKVLQVGSYGGFYTLSTAVGVSNNFYYDGTNARYINTSAASYYSQAGNVHGWYQAASGTAGAVASFTQAMTLDASGNLGVGTTSPSVFGVSSKNITVANSSGYSYLQLQGSSGNGGAIDFGDTSVRHAEIASLSGSVLAFYTNGSNSGNTITERARIDSSGNLLVGRTTTANTTVGSGLYSYGLIASSQSASTNANTSYDLYSTGAAAYRFYVGMGGTIYATSTTISAISDIRFKENVRDLDAGLSEVMALKPRLYDWKEGKGADTKNARGFIAQEFEEVFPDLIDEWKDPAPEGEEPYKSVRQDLIPVLVKAIQEQQALITQLTARISALESA